ncbi:hypothetical protein CALCODRAFT_243440, partial [Calocera cornea HHB12733]
KVTSVDGRWAEGIRLLGGDSDIDYITQNHSSNPPTQHAAPPPPPRHPPPPPPGPRRRLLLLLRFLQPLHLPELPLLRSPHRHRHRHRTPRHPHPRLRHLVPQAQAARSQRCLPPAAAAAAARPGRVRAVRCATTAAAGVLGRGRGGEHRLEGNGHGHGRPARDAVPRERRARPDGPGPGRGSGRRARVRAPAPQLRECHVPSAGGDRVPAQDVSAGRGVSAPARTAPRGGQLRPYERAELPREAVGGRTRVDATRREGGRGACEARPGGCGLRPEAGRAEGRARAHIPLPRLATTG